MTDYGNSLTSLEHKIKLFMQFNKVMKQLNQPVLKWGLKSYVK